MKTMGSGKPSERGVPAGLAEILRPDHTAVLVNDMQNDFCMPGGKVYDRAARGSTAVADLIATLSSLLSTARQAGARVVYTQQMHLPGATDVPDAHLAFLRRSGIIETPDDLPCITGTWGHRIIDALAPAAVDIVIEKAAFNDFHGSLLDKVLRVQGIETVLLSGVSSHGGILPSAYGLLDHGYAFFVLRDGVAGYSADLHQAALTLIGPHTLAIAEVLEAWQ